jgi:hypothetical protein
MCLRWQSITDLRDLLLDDLLEQAERHNPCAQPAGPGGELDGVACLFFQLLVVLIGRRVVRRWCRPPIWWPGWSTASWSSRFPKGSTAMRSAP